MKRVIAAPGRYVQYDGAWNDLAEYIELYGGKKIFLLMDAFAEAAFSEQLLNVLSAYAVCLQVSEEPCCEKELTELAEACFNARCRIIIGVGGGRILDLAKGVSDALGHPLLLLPSSAASDGPCSSQYVLHEPDGLCYMQMRRSPDVVLVDSNVIVRAPGRLLAAGIGDALSTCVECAAVYQAKGEAPSGGVSNEAALALSYLCQSALFQLGTKAYEDCNRNEVTQEFEKVIEAILYMSAVGFESGGLSVAHAIAYALDEFEECSSFLHGEKAAFGAIVQLQLMGTRPRDLLNIVELCGEIGLPTSLGELGFADEEDAAVKLAKLAMQYPESANIAMEYDEEMLAIACLS